MKKLLVICGALMVSSVLSGCVAGPYPTGAYYDGAEPYEALPAYAYDPLFFGGGYYPRYYRHGYGTYNWGAWHRGGGFHGARSGFHGTAAGAHGGGFHGGGAPAGGGHGGGGRR